jgi:hypothetical protein
MPTKPRKRRSKNQLVEKLQAVQATHPHQRVELWAQDEARFGQKGSLCRLWAPRGSRPRRPRQTEYGNLYLFGAVCCASGRASGWLMPWANTETMDAYLAAWSAQLPQDVHAVVLLDSAGWHTTRALTVPSNMTLLPLPARSPELNPAEALWRELRQRYLSNRVFADMSTLDEAVGQAWCALIANPARLASLCDFEWIRRAREQAATMAAN